MKRALILGCSHAAGSELFKDPSVFVRPENICAFELNNSYATRIAQKLGYNPDQQAEPGTSNDRMFRIWESQSRILDAQDLVIACWTGYNRSETYDEINGIWIPLGKEFGLLTEYQRQWIVNNSADAVGRLNKIKNILALNSMAQHMGIPVININSFWPVPYQSWPDYCRWPVPVDFLTWGNQNGYDKTEGYHFLLDAHENFAQYVVDAMQLTSVL